MAISFLKNMGTKEKEVKEGTETLHLSHIYYFAVLNISLQNAPNRLVIVPDLSTSDIDQSGKHFFCTV